VTAKKILKYTPFLGWFSILLFTFRLKNLPLTLKVALSGTVFIDRANKASALKSFDNAVKQMKKSKVFPELEQTLNFQLRSACGSFLKERGRTPIVPCFYPSRKEPFILQSKREFP
jgi:lysophosphatidate acyltransferase